MNRISCLLIQAAIVIFTLGILFTSSTGVSALVPRASCAQGLLSLPLSVQDFREQCKVIVKTDPTCQAIKEEGNRLRCDETAEQNKAFSGAHLDKKLGTCLKGFFLDSMADLGKFIFDLVKNLVGAGIQSVGDMGRFMVDEKFRAETYRKQAIKDAQTAKFEKAFLNQSCTYFSKEYPKNLVASGMDPVAALGTTLANPVLDFLKHAVPQLASALFPGFQCLNGEAKVHAICQAVGTLVMPPAVLFSFLKFGIKGLQAAAKSSGVIRAAIDAAQVRFAKAMLKIPGTAASRVAKAVEESAGDAGAARSTQVMRTRDTATKVALLKDADKLSPASRIRIATVIKGRALTQAEKDAVKEAHLVGRSEGRGFDTFTAADLLTKKSILRKAGFTSDEITLLLRNGVAGGAALAVAKSSAVEGAEALKSSTYGSAEQVTRALDKAHAAFAKSGDSYAAAAREVHDPHLFYAAYRSYVSAGDAAKAAQMNFEALKTGKVSANGVTKSVEQELQQAMTAQKVAPKDAAIAAKVRTLEQTLAKIREKLHPSIARTTASPAESVTNAVNEKALPNVSKITNPSEAKALATKEFMASKETLQKITTQLGRNRLTAEDLTRADVGAFRDQSEAASQHYLNAAAKQSFSDPNFAMAFETSLSGNGTVARETVKQLVQGPPAELNRFIEELTEQNLTGHVTALNRETLRDIAEELKSNSDKLYNYQLGDVHRLYLFTHSPGY